MYRHYVDHGPESRYCEDQYVGGAGPGPLSREPALFSTAPHGVQNFGQRDWHPEWVQPVRISVDSRNRDRYAHATANNITMELAQPLRKVRRIKLVKAEIPILRDGGIPIYQSVSIVEGHCAGQFEETRRGGGYPMGKLGEITLVPANVNMPDLAVFEDMSDDAAGWSCNFTQALARLTHLNISIWAWGWNTLPPPGHATPILYPLAAEVPPVQPADPADPPVPVPPAALANNIKLIFEIICEL